jgi:outer membrane protein TolC
VLLNVDTALSQSKNIADLYAIAAQGSKTAQDQIDKYRLDLDHGIAFQMSLLITALQDKVSNDVGQINALFSYMTLQAQMDSLTYSGVYAPLLTEKSP